MYTRQIRIAAVHSHVFAPKVFLLSILAIICKIGHQWYDEILFESWLLE